METGLHMFWAQFDVMESSTEVVYWLSCWADNVITSLVGRAASSGVLATLAALADTGFQEENHRGAVFIKLSRRVSSTWVKVE